MMRSKTPEYRSWESMRWRCLNPKATGYKYWGGRGVTICERWLNFDNFLADMGPRPAGTMIDRIDSNGNYEPGNCRWATISEQIRGRRMTRLNSEAVKVIRWAYLRGLTQKKLARIFNTHQSRISRIVSGQEWA
jgi:hypothetical protein